MEKQKLSLDKIIKLYNGLNVITNAGVGIKDIKKAFNYSRYKAEADVLYKAFQESASKATGTEEERQAAINDLLQTEYELEVPEISIDDFQDSKVEVPLIAMDYLQEFVKL